MTMSKRKFYRTTFEVVVLSEDESASGCELGELAYECFDGGMVGMLFERAVEELNGKQAAQALLAANSEAGFFRLTNDGEDEDEE